MKDQGGDLFEPTDHEERATSESPFDADICDGRDYFMACRIITIRLDAVPAGGQTNDPIAQRQGRKLVYP